MLLDLVHLRPVEFALSISLQAVGTRVVCLDIWHFMDSLCPLAESTFDQFRPKMALAADHVSTLPPLKRMLDWANPFKRCEK